MNEPGGRIFANDVIDPLLAMARMAGVLLKKSEGRRRQRN